MTRLLMAFILGWTSGALAKTSDVVSQGQGAVQKGIAWLKTQQNPDGSWTKIPFPAITGLAVLAMAQSGLTEKDPAVLKAVRRLTMFVKPDGGMYDQGAASQNTAICLMALAATKNPAYEPVIKNARAFLLSLQVDQGEGKNPEHPHYGGIGYDSKGIPDLQNLHWSLMALRMTDPGTGPDTSPTGDVKEGNVWDRAMLFLKRCQNLKGSNDQPWSLNDGGFIYATEPESKVEGNPTQSYGTMTYAGLLSFIYTQASKDHPSVQAAYKWIGEHYTLEENPMMGAQGLYYGYHTMAKALAAYGSPTIVDAKGRAEAYAELQRLVRDEAPWVFLWQQHDLYGVASHIEWTPRADEKVWMYEAKALQR